MGVLAAGWVSFCCCFSGLGIDCNDRMGGTVLVGLLVAGFECFGLGWCG